MMIVVESMVISSLYFVYHLRKVHHVLSTSANRSDTDCHSAARRDMPVDPLAHYHGPSDKLLRYMVTNLYRTGVTASAIPYDYLVQMDPEWIDSFQVVYLSALRARDGWCHGATSCHLQ